MKKGSVKAREGSSLIIVICVSAFLAAFALAMLYTASLSLSRANRRIEQERSYQLARSFSEMLEKELVRYRYLGNSFAPAPGDPEYNADLIAPSGDNTFYEYVVKFLEGQYGEYDPAHPDETIFHFTAAEPSGTVDENAYGTVRAALYKEAAEDRDELTGTIDPDADLTDINTKPIQRYTFIVEVTVEVDGTAYVYQTKYRQMVKYDVRFTYGPTKTPVVKVGNVWHEGSASGTVITIPSGEVIEYEYLGGENNIKLCTFENIYEKKGDAVP